MSDHKPLSFLVELLQGLQLSWRLFWDRRMPLWTKSVPLGAAVYLLWPADLLADPILGLGQLDDLALILLATQLFISLAPASLLSDLRGASPFGQTVAGQHAVRDVEGKTHLLENPDEHTR